MIEKALVSVVVPIYNMEKYLDRCVKSIISQSYQNLEIILIDDGSTDHSSQMCDAWAEKDSRIQVVHKKNEGLGFARNTGIFHATGKYICFLDSDDYYAPEMIESCCSIAEKENADLVCFGEDVVTQDGIVVHRRIPTPPRFVFEGEEVRSCVIPKLLSTDEETGEAWNLSLSACFSLFSVEMIRRSGWKFVSERDILSEDFYSMLKLYKHVEKLVIIPQVLYHYTINPFSLSRIYRKDRYDRIVHFTHAMLELIEEFDSPVRLQPGVAKIHVGLTIGAMKQIVSSRDNFFEKYQNIKRIVQDGFLQCLLQDNDFSKESYSKWLLIQAVRRKLVLACCLLVYVRNLKDTCKIMFLKRKQTGRNA